MKTPEEWVKELGTHEPHTRLGPLPPGHDEDEFWPFCDVCAADTIAKVQREALEAAARAVDEEEHVSPAHNYTFFHKRPSAIIRDLQ